MKTDGRVRYTRMVIKSSLLKLLTNKPVKNITVKELCELAQINRATFYLHYQDPYDLLEQIENELFEDLSSTVSTKQDDISSLIPEVLKIIEKNSDLCRVLFSENGDKMFLRRIMDIKRENHVTTLQQQYPHASRTQLDYQYEFLASGAVAVIAQWVRSGMQEAPLELGRMLQTVNETWLHALS